MYKRTSRKGSALHGQVPRYLCKTMESPYSRVPYHGTTVSASVPVSRDCMCGREFEFRVDGCYLCSVCGQVKGSYYEDMPAWHGLATKGPPTCYDCRTHLANHLAPVTRYLEARYVEKIKAVFPLIYRTFFRVAPHRKNFCSYGFVIRELLRMMHVECGHLPLKIVKTKAKLKENQKYWEDINGLINIRIS